ncbi:sugar phosphate isomerase/epimerase [Paenibacillus sp. J2TS4]|uniref:sugar phosphate isomerase/epimerase family protein n=1 Tax=Paenibacillus sp. J2TS4 TaxID=2807194 RepID=UPI001B188A7E|nr:sugar phosphate isomerase/epimerase family protein [Paenibacillus sp. J2TS4]GIP36133.1 hypothetical protein J2TS4_53430 [Paenibacillus sp. J2TS4]
MNISTSLNVFPTEYPMEDAIRRCQAAGFQHLDFNYWDHQPNVMNLSWEEEERWAREIRSIADRIGVRFTQMHGPVHGNSFGQMVDGLNADSFLLLAERSLRTAAILGVPWVVFHPSLLSPMGEEPYQEVVDFNCQYYRRLIPTMEATGVGIALENMFDRIAPGINGRRRKYCALAEELAELIDKIDHPLVGACWDTGHGHKQGLRQGASIRILGSYLKTTHIQDNDGVIDQHLLPYQGTIDWTDVAEALKAVRYEGDFTYEAHQSVRPLPDPLRDAALSYGASVGQYIVSQL